MGELIPSYVSQKDIKEESFRRASRAGLCNKNGEPLGKTKIQNIVGFGKSKLNVWPRDKNGNLIE